MIWKEKKKKPFILTTLETPKNIFCFNDSIMDENSKQNHPGHEHYEQPVLWNRCSVKH